MHAAVVEYVLQYARMQETERRLTHVPCEYFKSEYKSLVGRRAPTLCALGY